jgi:hypothetical protein
VLTSEGFLTSTRLASACVMSRLLHCLPQADAASGREKAAAEAKAAKARSKLDGALEKVAAVERAPPPKLEVGCLLFMLAARLPQAAHPAVWCTHAWWCGGRRVAA